MAEIVAGRSLDRVLLKVVRASRQSFALSWKKDGVDLPLTGYTVTIEFGSTVWTAVNNANISTWTLTEAQSTIPDRYTEGIIVLTSASGREVAYAVTLEVQGA